VPARAAPELPSNAPPPASSTPWLTYGAFGVGALGLGIGTVFGIVAMGKKSTIDERCEDTRCDRVGKAAADSAQQAALISTIGLAVGGAAVVTGAVLLLTRPSSTARSAFTPLASFDGRAAVLGASGRF
jgi:hypothetical protein